MYPDEIHLRNTTPNSNTVSPSIALLIAIPRRQLAVRRPCFRTLAARAGHRAAGCPTSHPRSDPRDRHACVRGRGRFRGPAPSTSRCVLQRRPPDVRTIPAPFATAIDEPAPAGRRRVKSDGRAARLAQVPFGKVRHRDCHVLNRTLLCRVKPRARHKARAERSSGSASDAINGAALMAAGAGRQPPSTAWSTSRWCSCSRSRSSSRRSDPSATGRRRCSRCRDLPDLTGLGSGMWCPVYISTK